MRTSIPDDRFTPAEVSAIQAFEADADGRACLRRINGFPDPAYLALMQSAQAKGYSIWRGRVPRDHRDPHLTG